MYQHITQHIIRTLRIWQDIQQKNYVDPPGIQDNTRKTFRIWQPVGRRRVFTGVLATNSFYSYRHK